MAAVRCRPMHRRVGPREGQISQRRVPRKGVSCYAVSQEVLLGAAAGVLGIGTGIGLPILFGKLEQRDKDRLERVRQINRQTLKETGETLPEEELQRLRPQRFLDNTCA